MESPDDPSHGDRIGIVVAMLAPLDRDAMACLLNSQEGFTVVGTAGSHQEAIAACVRLRPRVLVLGLQILWPPNVDPIETLRMCSPKTEVVAIAPHATDRCIELNPSDDEGDCCPLAIQSTDCVLTALARGARAAFHRDIPTEDLFGAIRAAAKGMRWAGQGAVARASAPSPLSQRERAVASLIGRGRSNREIADGLGISEATVKKHLGHVLRKLKLSDRLQLGLCVARHPMFFRND